jgi:hypothetical protein
MEVSELGLDLDGLRESETIWEKPIPSFTIIGYEPEEETIL